MVSNLCPKGPGPCVATNTALSELSSFRSGVSRKSMLEISPGSVQIKEQARLSV